MVENFLPMGSKILVRIVSPENKTQGGLHIPDNASAACRKGEVVKTGPGEMLDNGTLYESGLKPGDLAYFERFAGTPIELGDGEFLALDQSEVIGAIRSHDRT